MTDPNAATPAAHRTGFGTLAAGGLNWESLPLRLFAKGNAKSWDPAEIELSRDAADWAGLTDDERRAAAMLYAQFVAGEEAVTEDLQPFMAAMAAEGRLGDEMYLTQFCFEEAKHLAIFRRWLDAVGLTEDLHDYVAANPGYRAIFYQALPEALRALAHDPSPTAQVRASITYNHVVEGILALTGYHAWNLICVERDIFPGMRQIIKRIGDDERRHMAWGTFTCRRHVAADDTAWQVVQDRMGELLPHAVRQIEWVFEQYDGQPGGMPFAMELSEFVGYATDRAGRRLGAIEAARGIPVGQIDLDLAPETLEERFAAEDAANATRGGPPKRTAPRGSRASGT